MINTRVHDHGPDEAAGTDCPEREVDIRPGGTVLRTQLRGLCLEDDGCGRGAHAAYSRIPRSGTCDVPPDSDTTYEPAPAHQRVPDGARCQAVVYPNTEVIPDCPHVRAGAHRCRTAKSIDHTTHICTCGWAWLRDVAPAEPLPSLDTSTPRRVYLVHLLTDLMASLDVELDELAEVRCTTDRQLGTDAEHAADKLQAVWAKAAEARTAIRSTHLGYMPLPEVG